MDERDRVEGEESTGGADGGPTLTLSGPVLLYDGVCALCNGAVKFVLARDPGGAMKFAPLQGEFAERVHEAYPWVRDVDSLVLVEPATPGSPQRVRVKSAAALAIASYVGGGWRLLAPLRVVPPPIRDAVYDFVARHRYRWFGQFDACPLPPPEVRSRFLS